MGDATKHMTQRIMERKSPESFGKLKMRADGRRAREPAAFKITQAGEKKGYTRQKYR